MAEWRDVKGSEGLYKISETGEVYTKIFLKYSLAE